MKSYLSSSVYFIPIPGPTVLIMALFRGATMRGKKGMLQGQGHQLAKTLASMQVVTNAL